MAGGRMGRPGYDEDRALETSRSYVGLSAREIFANKFDARLNPRGVTLRESRDSENHPNSLPIIIGLDMTGSMHRIPKLMITEDLNNMMRKMLEAGLSDPQIMFMGIGDHECDRAPLQISQYESDDQSLDEWLRSMWPEGRGGGNDGESYMLPWYFAANKTEIDSLEKRNTKGFLFSIGDEKTLKNLPGSAIADIFGDTSQDISAERLLEQASEKYNVFHVHVREGSNGNRQDVIDDWTNLIGDNLIIVEDHTQVTKAISDKILEVSAASGVIEDVTVGGANLIVTE